MRYLLAVVVLTLPFASSASTFFYVDVEGNIAAVEAPEAQAALTRAGNPSSGVLRDMGEVAPGMVDNTVVRVNEEIPMVFERPSVQSWSGAALYVPTMNWNGLMPGGLRSLPW